MDGELIAPSASAKKNRSLFVETFHQKFLPPPGAPGTVFFRNLTYRKSE